MNYIQMDRDTYFDIINQDSYGIEILESAKKLRNVLIELKYFKMILENLI